MQWCYYYAYLRFLKFKLMKKIFLLLIISITFSLNLFSQRSADSFELILSDQKVSNSLYNTIGFLDSRYDTTNCGIIQLGAFNKKARVVMKIPFSKQLTFALNSMIDNTAKDGELLLQLRQFSFAEITGALSEKGYCYVKADLYSKLNNYYLKLSSVDTVIIFSSMDVTKALLTQGSYTITDFIFENLLIKAIDGDQYSFEDIVNIENIEKQKIPLYNVSHLADGLYENFKSFMSQTPDKQIMVEMKNDEINTIKTLNKKGKYINVKNKDIYAIVDNGHAYIATDYGFYPLQKKDNDFYFTGDAKVNANSVDVITAGIFFGVIGSLIASNAKSTFEMKIDHSNGGFIRIREIIY